MDPTQLFYDQLAADYDLIYADWDAAVTRQGDALDALISEARGPGRHDVLDCACGIGTQALGLAARGHRVTGSDLSPVAAARAQREARARGLRFTAGAADMRALPFADRSFDVVVCADNSLPPCSLPSTYGPRSTRCAECCGPAGCFCCPHVRTTNCAASGPVPLRPR